LNEQDQDRFEAELRRIPPARVPNEFFTRLRTSSPCVIPSHPRPQLSAVTAPVWWRDWRWLAPALAVALAGLLVLLTNIRSRSDKQAPAPPAYGFKAGDVQMDRQLVSDFDVVARLPGGEPVRFHCQKWNDQMVMTDTNRGVEIIRDTPTIAVVPVRFETY
jgi:hypothetical protein